MTGAVWWLVAKHSGLALARRPGRSLGVCVGIAVGVTVFLVSVGWAQTAGAQVNQTFDRLAATEVRLRDTRAETATDAPLPDDFTQRAMRIHGVVAAGRYWQAGGGPVRVAPGAEPVDLSVVGVDPGFLAAARVRLAAGRLPDDAMVAARQPVALLGPGAAASLGLTPFVAGTAVDVGGVQLSVMGVLDDVGSAPELEHAVIVLAGAPVTGHTGAPAAFHMGALVRVELGAATRVASLLPVAARPDTPQRLGVIVPPEPAALREQVHGSLTAMAYGTAGLTLFVGGIGILNALSGSVGERLGEIGLRRSLGASRRAVAAQFVLEGVLVGLGGAVIGTVAGITVLVAATTVHGWTPVMDRGLLVAAPGFGMLLGALAAAYPARRAAAVPPAVALRR